MSQERVAELEGLLLAANVSVAALTRSQALLTGQLADAELRARKLRRKSRRDENTFRTEIAFARSHRG